MNIYHTNLFKKIVETIYQLYGVDVFKKYDWLKKTLMWSSEERNEWKLNRLGHILEFAWKNIPFYKKYWLDHGVEFFRPRSLDELQKYPILTKEIFRQNADRIQPSNLSSIRYRKWHTGGTTGQPVHYNRDLEQWALNEAFHLWGWEQLGYIYGDPVGVLAGGSLVPERQKISGKLRSWMHRRTFLFGVSMDAAMARKYHQLLIKQEIKYLYGYPSILYLFGKHLQDQALSIPTLTAAVTTAEMLLPSYRDSIEKTLKCKVYNNLGCNDGGYEAYECEKREGLHYNDLQSILEVDSSGTLSEGGLIITNLWNKSTPFIRYENGDLIKLSKKNCSCGSVFPLISEIKGRTADILTFGNGQSLAGPALTLIFGEMAIDGWQVVQTELNRLEVRIKNKEQIKAEYLSHINRILRHYLSDEIIIDIKHVDKLKLPTSGKWKPIWSEV